MIRSLYFFKVSKKREYSIYSYIIYFIEYNWLNNEIYFVQKYWFLYRIDYYISQDEI